MTQIGFRKMATYAAISILCACLFFSCHVSKVDFKLSKKESLTFETDSGCSVTDKTFDQIHGKSALIYYDRSNQLIRMRGLGNDNLDSSIRINEFSNGVYDCWIAKEGDLIIDGFVVDEVSGNLIVHEFEQNEFTKISDNGFKKHKVDLGKKHIVTPYSNLQIANQFLGAVVVGGESMEDFFSSSFLLVYDHFKDETSHKLVVPYPTKKRMINSHLRIPSAALTPEFAIVSFGYCDSLLAYNLKTSELETHLAVSEKELKLIEFDPNVPDKSGFWQFQEGYSSVHYDEYRHLIYRITMHKNKQRYFTSQEAMFHKDFSIIVFNDQFEKLGEFFFDGSQYCYREIYSVPEGLIIGKNFIHDFEFKFDSLEFDIFQFEGL
jgi:hypothetical protein